MHPSLKELGLDLVQNSPFGIGAPKGAPRRGGQAPARCLLAGDGAGYKMALGLLMTHGAHA